MLRALLADFLAALLENRFLPLLPVLMIYTILLFD